MEWIVHPVNQYLVLEQFADLPVVIFTSYTQRFQGNGVDKSEGRVEGYDKETGNTICDETITVAPF